MRVHPTAEVSPSAEIGPGTRIWHQAQVRERARIGANCIVSKGVYIDFEESRKSLLQSEINRVRSHAMRTALRTRK